VQLMRNVLAVGGRSARRLSGAKPGPAHEVPDFAALNPACA
jgi:hypothetical protein